jgi:hypothetical protein
LSLDVKFSQTSCFTNSDILIANPLLSKDKKIVTIDITLDRLPVLLIIVMSAAADKANIIQTGPACLVSPPALSACLPDPAHLASPPASFVLLALLLC